MDDIQLLIYIAFLAIALLSRFLGKKKKNAQQAKEKENSPEDKGDPPMTFEDLLKEFTGSKEEREEKKERERAEIRYEKEREEQERAEQERNERREYEFESELPDDDEINDIYEQSVKAAEKAKSPDDQDKGSRFKNFDIEEDASENKIAQEVREMLSNPGSAAKAIVLSEIINRKY